MQPGPGPWGQEQHGSHSPPSFLELQVSVKQLQCDTCPFLRLWWSIFKGYGTWQPWQCRCIGCKSGERPDRDAAAHRGPGRQGLSSATELDLGPGTTLPQEDTDPGFLPPHSRCRL